MRGHAEDTDDHGQERQVYVWDLSDSCGKPSGSLVAPTARPSTYCDPQNKPKYEQEEVPEISSVEIWILLYFIDAFKGNVLQ